MRGVVRVAALMWGLVVAAIFYSSSEWRPRHPFQNNKAPIYYPHQHTQQRQGHPSVSMFCVDRGGDVERGGTEVHFTRGVRAMAVAAVGEGVVRRRIHRSGVKLPQRPTRDKGEGSHKWGERWHRRNTRALRGSDDMFWPISSGNGLLASVDERAQNVVLLRRLRARHGIVAVCRVHAQLGQGLHYSDKPLRLGS